ncbi:MAG: methylated-DNA--[protein]-cysteine S-methyltransferase [Micrococcus sp.]|nr:methylated-DNA--[protein]-cysteine S-methyltransferase [Micrococcus sp.]
MTTPPRIEPEGAPAFSVAEAELAGLAGRLAHRAEEESLLEVAYRIVDSPVGRLLLAATERGLVRVAFEREGFDGVLSGLAEKIGPRVLHAPWKLDGIVAELDEYFAGRRREFGVPLDFALSHGFRLSVQRRLPDIRYGRTMSYRQVAELLDRPAAVRAVGTACATNPLPVVVPCHRVLRSDGTLGGYLGGVEAKATLLDLEHGAAAA